jgi:hypothetical protein
MRLYSLIVDFKGSTCVHQVWANDVVQAVDLWFDLELPIFTNDVLKLEQSSLRSGSRDVVPLQDCVGAWCCSFLDQDELALLNIFDTRVAE